MQVSREFAEHFIEKQLHYFLTIAPQKSCEKPVKRKNAFDEKFTPSMKHYRYEPPGMSPKKSSGANT